MPRKPVSYKLDTRLMEPLKVLATRRGLTVSRLVETLIINALVNSGDLPNEFEVLPETRGGNRRQKTR